MLPKKYLSGYEKRKCKRQQDRFIQSQQGAIHKFFPTSSKVVPDENPVDAPNIEEVEQQVDDNLSEQVDAFENENLQIKYIKWICFCLQVKLVCTYIIKFSIYSTVPIAMSLPRALKMFEPALWPIRRVEATRSSILFNLFLDGLSLQSGQSCCLVFCRSETKKLQKFF